MSYSFSIKDINFLQKFCILTNLFLITPWYDFQSQIFIWPVLSKLYACCVGFLKIFLILSTIQDALNNIIFLKLFFTQKLFFITFVTFAMFQSIFQIGSSTFLYQNKWKQLLINFEFVDAKLGNNNKKERNVFKNFYFRFFARNVIFFTMFVPYVYIWVQISGGHISLAMFLNIFEIYNQFLILVFLHCLAECFEVRYKCLNQRLVFVCCNSKNLVSDLKPFKKLLQVLAENIDLFNNSFGYYFLIIIVYCGLHIVHCANFIFLKVSFGDARFEFQAAAFNAIMITFLTVSTFLSSM